MPGVYWDCFSTGPVMLRVAPSISAPVELSTARKLTWVTSRSRPVYSMVSGAFITSFTPIWVFTARVISALGA